MNETTEISDEEWDVTFRTNIHAVFYLCKAAIPHLGEGGSIINTTSVNADKPNPKLLAYTTTKCAVQNSPDGLAQLVADQGIRVNCVASGPVWTPLTPPRCLPKWWRASGRARRLAAPPNRANSPALRHAGKRRGKLHLGRHHFGDRRKAIQVKLLVVLTDWANSETKRCRQRFSASPDKREAP